MRSRSSPYARVCAFDHKQAKKLNLVVDEREPNACKRNAKERSHFVHARRQFLITEFL